MAQFIPKDAVVAEIDNLIDKDKHHDSYQCAFRDGNNSTLYALKECINTLGVKEIDIEDSVKETLAQKYVDYTFRRHNIDPESKEGQLIYYAYIHGINACLKELKVKKGE